jgi:Phosphate-selective porin O and P
VYAPAFAAEQDAGIEARLDSLNAEVAALQKAKPPAVPVKLSGFAQARWETAENSADSIEVTSNAVSTANRNRFYIRRARLKVAVDDPAWGQGVTYINAGESGEVELIEAFVTLYDPWTEDHRHQLTVGQMNVPFGFDLEYSTSHQEALERSQAERALFPGERDRGAKIESRWTPHFQTTVGVYNGTTLQEDPNFVSADANGNKAVVGRVRVMQGTLRASISGYVARAATPLTGPDIVTDKTCYGADVEAGYALRNVGNGLVRGELFAGHQVNRDSVSALTAAAGGSAVRVPGAVRSHVATDVFGFYVTWAQDFARHYQFAARLDVWDPNVDADHDEFRRVTLAMHGFHGDHIRASVAYEIPMTDRATGSGSFDDPKDNRWTVQFQHRF